MPKTDRPRKVRRLLARLAAGVAVLLVLAIVVGLLVVDRWARGLVERSTVRVMNLGTTTDGAALSVWGSRLRVDNYRIASPPGFSAEPMVAIESGVLDFEWAGLRTEPARLVSATFVRPRLLVENVNGRMNVRDMIDRLTPVPKPIRLTVDEATVQDATVVIRPGAADLPAEIVVTVPTFKLYNLGGDPSAGGATVGTIVKHLVAALAERAADAEQMPPQLRVMLKDPLAAVVMQVGAEARRRIEQALPGGIGRTMTGLFGPKPAGARGGRPGGPSAATRPADTATQPAFPTRGNARPPQDLRPDNNLHQDRPPGTGEAGSGASTP